MTGDFWTGGIVVHAPGYAMQAGWLSRAMFLAQGLDQSTLFVNAKVELMTSVGRKDLLSLHKLEISFGYSANFKP